MQTHHLDPGERRREEKRVGESERREMRGGR
jgi:hypothetical protein